MNKLKIWTMSCKCPTIVERPNDRNIFLFNILKKNFQINIIPMYFVCFTHLPQTPSKPPDVKSWTTFFTNKFEKEQKNKPYKVFSRFQTDLSLVGLNCLLYIILS